ncbi:site-2 protease family protein [Patescibacteria group bacterium]|nr:site-2 protease family protein [Patescibacteria group bacterium]MBU4480864.1 site-2 protease family protein [Patescibacteria group bacterium]
MMSAILIFILILSFLILSHEFGHFILAKFSGVKVEEFGLGLPPRALGVYTERGNRKFILGPKDIQTNSTIYSLNLIPFGGFNKIYGEEVKTEKDSKDSESFASKSLPTRTLIVSGGVLVGILSAVVIFYFILGFNNFSTYQGLIFNYKFPFGSQNNFTMVSAVLPDSPAERAKLIPYDLILKANGSELKSTKEFTGLIKTNEGKEVLLKVKNLRTKETREIVVFPETKPSETGAKIGVGLRELAEIRYSGILDKIFSGFLHSANLVHYSLTALYNLIKVSILTQSISPIASQTTGIVGIFAITKLVIQETGLGEIFNLIALLSLALAITNLLPLPALDGGRLIFLGYEAVFKKRVSSIFERKVNAAGLVGLILLYILITYKDILQYKDIILK